RAGCAWRMLPRELPSWGTVHALVLPPLAAGRHLAPDPRPVASAGAPGCWPRDESERGHYRQPVRQDDRKRGGRGYDTGKKVKGRKRHIAVDPFGRLLAVWVHPANIQDRDGAWVVLLRLKGRFPRLERIWVDGGYAGRLVKAVQRGYGWVMEVVMRRPE